MRLSQDQKTKMMKIRKNTGVKNWNVICRWALCTSLAIDDNPPRYIKGGKSGVEMDWDTFTGKDASLVYDAILKKTGSERFYSHIQRGIDQLCTKKSLAG